MKAEKGALDFFLKECYALQKEIYKQNIGKATFISLKRERCFYEISIYALPRWKAEGSYAEL